jgi:hypothetical protein
MMCWPVCDSGCVHGECTAPNVCKCHFGFVGTACDLECRCNGHSECAGPDKLDVCLECRNNTMGPQCDKCKPLYVGDPRNNNVCLSCKDYCNGHTDLCLPQSAVGDLSRRFNGRQLSGLTREDLLEFLEEGAAKGAVCLNCGSNTRGDKCDLCIEGHFRGHEEKKTPCIP